MLRLIGLSAGVLLGAGCGVASAGQYTVQIGALGEPYAEYAHPAGSFGEVTTSVSATGLTLYTVGLYDSEPAASQARNALVDAGYADAFVRTIGPATSSTVAEVAPRLDRVPPELRDKVVYLDGVLHVKEGERFTPLNEYLR